MKFIDFPKALNVDSGFCLWDFLILVASCTYLAPFNPIIGNFLVWLWLVVQCIGCGKASGDRRFLWPIAVVLLLASRSLWLQEMPHPLSLEDVVLFCATVVVFSRLKSARFHSILSMLCLSLPLAFIHIGSKPWSPNLLVGSNQAGYLFGVAFIFACFRFALGVKNNLGSWMWLLMSLISFICIWQTNSRAALISVPVVLVALLVKNSRNMAEILAKASAALFALVIVYVLRLNLLGISGLPGLKYFSDLGRLDIVSCYLAVPFGGVHRIWSGIGLNSDKVFCQQLYLGSPMDHSHSLFVQVWVDTGLFGVLGLLLLFWLFADNWLLRRKRFSDFDVSFGLTIAAYFFLQGIVDLSLLHWPLAIFITGVCLAIPLQYFEPSSG